MIQLRASELNPNNLSTTMRRFITRKRRCFFLMLCTLLIFMLIYSYFPDPHVKASLDPVISKNLKLTMAPVEPKFVVLEEPGPVPNRNTNIRDKDSGTDLPHPKQNAGTEAQRLALKGGKPQHAAQDTKLRVNETDSIDLVKDKTLSQLGVMGEKNNEKKPAKIAFVKSKWHLDVSFEDIGNIMKDTAFLNKLKPLNLDGPMLTSTRNRTSNFSLSMPFKMGYCDCWERYCYCCVQLANERLHLNNKTCLNVTFMSKSHELSLNFSIDNKHVYSGSIPANTPPLLCLGSTPSVLDMCVHFFNMTYKVDRHSLHKSQLLGCTDISLNIYNKTINVFPVDCFQIPGDPNHHRKEENIILPNFVP